MLLGPGKDLEFFVTKRVGTLLVVCDDDDDVVYTGCSSEAV